jgi:6-phosphogluconolactonase (cycloisomerase 2 family)
MSKRLGPALGALVAACLAAPTAPAQQFVYVANGGSDTISAFAVDGSTGALTAIPGSPFATEDQVLPVSVHPSGRYLYTTRANGLLYGYRIHPATGALTRLASSLPTGGTVSPHVALDPGGVFAYVTNATPSTISVFRIDAVTGELTATAGPPVPTGGTAPFAAATDPRGRVLYVPNRTSNNVSALRVDRQTGALVPVAGSPFGTGGSNPTSVAVDPTGRFLYVANLLSDTVSAFSIDAASGALSPLAGSPFPAGGSGPTLLTVDPAGRTVYTANQSSDNVSALSINPTTGALTPVAGSPFTAGDSPMSVALDLKGRFAYVANRLGNTVSAFTVHPTTGALAAIGPAVATGANPQVVVASRNFTRGDFGGDGLTDLLWRHEVSGENVVWHMNGAVLAGGTFTTPSALPDASWKMVGTHDFNRDRETDVLWRHEVSGENVLWYMAGTTLTSGTFLSPAALADVNWKMAGTGDFDLDGAPDIAWHHRGSGQIVLWYMNGRTLVAGTFTQPAALPDTAWRLVGVADFNADHHPDLLWHHQVSGEIVVWYMDDATLLAGTFTSPSALSDTGWTIAAVGDYNDDRRPDLVWRHQGSGQDVIWLLNGVTLVSGTFTSALPDPSWRIVGPR